MSNDDDGKRGLNAPVMETAAVDVARFAQRLVYSAHNLAECVNERLAPIMSESPIIPTPPATFRREGTARPDLFPTSTSLNPVKPLPPLFADLRAALQQIETALASIEDAMLRVDL